MNLNQVTLPCHDLAESVRFYERLGFKQIVSSPPHYARFECESGTTFSLDLKPESSGRGSVVVYFEVEHLDAEVARLKSEGLTFESDPVDQPWAWREAYLRDPAGNLLCLYFAGKQRRFPAHRLPQV
jgi:hydroxymethylpyrimidine/phosphomethylpyrimidine kinase